MKKLLVLFTIAGTFLIYSCGGGDQSSASGDAAKDDATTEPAPRDDEYDAKRGKGKFTNVEIAATLDPTMVTSGERVYNVKCASCHKLTDERLVGPGWKDVTKRRTPEWVMNFVTNTEEMIDKDPELQAQLEICLVRMPNQSVSDEAARGLYEFMRKNDGVK